MAILLLLVLISAFIGASDATWCICRSELSSSALQETLDYACGAGADCTPIHQNGACYLPNTVLAHCSYAANSYFQRKAQGSGICDFSGTATVTTSDPSYSGCSYPSTARESVADGRRAAIVDTHHFLPSPISSAAGTGTTTGSTTPGASTFSPGLGPSVSTDGNGSGGLLMAGTASLCLAIILPALILLTL